MQWLYDMSCTVESASLEPPTWRLRWKVVGEQEHKRRKGTCNTLDSVFCINYIGTTYLFIYLLFQVKRHFWMSNDYIFLPFNQYRLWSRRQQHAYHGHAVARIDAIQNLFGDFKWKIVLSYNYQVPSLKLETNLPVLIGAFFVFFSVIFRIRSEDRLIL